ncbi:MAG: adenylate/guanylate cyclase domain-containing protein [Candidatus Acidiferrales bacterium]
MKFIRRIAGALWRRRVPLAISMCLTIGALGIYLAAFVGERPTPAFDFIHRLELDALDTRFRLRPARDTHPDPRIVIVDIDERSQELLGRWPFSRAEFARMLDALHADGAAVVSFDITFSEPDQSSAPIRALAAQVAEQEKQQGAQLDPRIQRDLDSLAHAYDTDDQFAQSIRRFGPVVLGNFFLYSEADLRGVSDQSLDRYANILADFPFPEERAENPKTGAGDLARLMQSYAPWGLTPQGTQANLETLSAALSAAHGQTGFFNVEPDPDGVVRHALLVLPYGRSKDLADWDLYASLDVQTVRLFLHIPDDQMSVDFGPAGIDAIEFGPGLATHPDPIGRLLINYQGPVRTYRYVSMADVVKNNFAPGTFKGKIVLVGASATGIGDLRSTPYGGLDYPGVEIHANVIDNILNRHALKRGPAQVAWDIALILFFGIPVGVWLAFGRPRWLWAPLLLLALFAFGVYDAFLHDWWLNFTMPALTLVSNVGLVALYRALVEEKEKRKVRGAFQQYLSAEVIRRLLESPELLEPRRTDITVMFSDIRGFTTISEKLDAQELAALLNRYLTDMTRIVFDRGGTLDKYIGDAVMAFWGAPIEQADHAVSACHAAIEMMERLAPLQRQWQAEGKPRLDIGIGLNTGAASVGNMGSTLRYGYTALGDSVNLASRLEGLNKDYGTHILVSQSTFEQATAQAAQSAGSQFIFRELDLIRVKGKTQPVGLYELIGRRDASGNSAAPDTAQRAVSPDRAERVASTARAERVASTDSAEQIASTDERLAQFARGRALYRERRWVDAREVFANIAERWPDDGPARVFRERCEDYLIEEPDPDWDGVFTMLHK